MYNVHVPFCFFNTFFFVQIHFSCAILKICGIHFQFTTKKNRSSYLNFGALKVSVYGTDYYIPLLCDSVELSNQTLLVFLWSIIKPNQEADPHIDLQKTRLSFIIVNQLKLYNYFCISVPLPLQDDHLNIGWYGSLECHHQKKKFSLIFVRHQYNFLTKTTIFLCVLAQEEEINNKIISCRPTFFSHQVLCIICKKCMTSRHISFSV